MGKPGSEVSPWWMPRDNHLSPHLQMDSSDSMLLDGLSGPKKDVLLPWVQPAGAPGWDGG